MYVVEQLAHTAHSDFFGRLWFLYLSIYASLKILSTNASPARILVFSRTVAFRHDSIPTAIEALTSHSSIVNAVFDHTEDQTQFTDDNLQRYDAILFLSNTGEGMRNYPESIVTLTSREFWTTAGSRHSRDI